MMLEVICWIPFVLRPLVCSTAAVLPSDLNDLIAAYQSAMNPARCVFRSWNVQIIFIRTIGGCCGGRVGLLSY